MMAGSATHVVDASQDSDSDGFTTVGAAIRAANPGDRILVRPGRYEESLLIDKPLELIGDGPLAEIEIWGTDTNVLTFGAETGRVANLTLAQPWGPSFRGVFIARGQLHLEECDISSRTGVCVSVHGGADARLRRNVIHDAWEVGVLFYQGGGGILEDSEIVGCRLDGVEVRDGSDPVLRRNVIRDSRRAGVFIHGDGRGTLEENQITGNQESGVRLSGGGRPALRQNRITGNGLYGIYVHDGVGSLDEGNDLSGNRQGERGHEEPKASRSVLPSYMRHGSHTGWNPGSVAAYLDF